jgi:hypothetical protein
LGLRPRDFGRRWLVAGLYHSTAIQIWYLAVKKRRQYSEPDGSITDGDDHAWSSNRKVLAGGGGWRNLDFTTSSLLGKLARSEDSDGSSADDMEEIQRQFFLSFKPHDGGEEQEVSCS